MIVVQYSSAGFMQLQKILISQLDIHFTYYIYSTKRLLRNFHQCHFIRIHHAYPATKILRSQQALEFAI